MRAWSTAGVSLVLALTLAGCGNDMSDLHQFVATARAQKVTQIPPIPKMTPYVPFAYDQASRRDPFVPADANQDKSAQKHHSASGIHPDFNRPPQPLEQYPLDALRMVGTLTFNNILYAMIAAPDGIIHRVSVGNYMGKHYGRIMKITASEVDLKEIIPDGFGGWRYKTATLRMAE
ncbi:MAG: pilus assembly protein PilP [Sinobacteraceae bacterium]|nr:pilus assembly protein PilP [Nevskiaceae bacterium]